MKAGDVFVNKKGLEFVILGRNNQRSGAKHTYYDIRFIESGYTDTARSDLIRYGCVRDKLSKSLCGIGAIGYANARSNFKEYGIWRDMIYRCYSKKDKSYKYYGGKGVEVCDRWKRFDLFLEDIPGILGFDEQLFYNGKLRLDKDILSGDKKLYSPETTIWITDAENQKQRAKEYNAKNIKYATFPDGHTEQIFNLSDFCKEHNIHYQNATLCLSGKQKATKGFVFFRQQQESTDYPMVT